MSTTFSRSMRSLNADSFRRSILGLLLVAVLLAAGVAWFFLARVMLCEVTDTARLEVVRAVHPVEAAITGRVAATHAVLGQEVQVGDVLVELDTRAEQLRLAEERTRLDALSRQLKALREEITAEEQTQREERKAAPLALNEARVRYREAEAVARFAREEVKRLTRLHEGGHLAEVDLRQAKSEAQRGRAAANALRLAVSKLEKEQQAAQPALEEARARCREAEATALFAEEEVKRLARLHEGGVIAEVDLLRARAEAQKQRASADAIRLAATKLEKEQQTAQPALEEARARYREAEAVEQFAEEEVERLTRLYAEGHPDEVILRRARVNVQQRQAAVDALRLAVSRLEQEQRAQESNRQTRLAHLEREVVQFEGEIATTAAAIERLEYEVENRRIRAPVAGQIGEFANPHTGSIVTVGDRLGAIVPPGELKAIAYFLPPAALGRIQVGQSARLRFDGFPWTQYGSVSATVASIAREPRHGRVRVELTVHPHPASPIPLQHGLPGMVEVQVARVSPATLVLRAAGRLLSGPRTAPGGEVEP